MTEANQKTLYKHFVATGQTESANNILNVYPQFEDIPEPIPEPPQPEIKPKKKKRSK